MSWTSQRAEYFFVTYNKFEDMQKNIWCMKYDTHYNIMCISWFQSKLQLTLSLYIYLHLGVRMTTTTVRFLQPPSKVGTKILYQKHEDRNAKRHPPYSRLGSKKTMETGDALPTKETKEPPMLFHFLCFFNHGFIQLIITWTCCWHANFLFPWKECKAPSNADGTHCATPWDKS